MTWRAAAPSTTVHLCSVGSATHTQPPPTSRSTRRHASCPAASCSTSPPTRRCCEGLEVALPFWLDRPDDEAMDLALTASDMGFDAVWIGEMATYDAFALATAIGLRAPEMTLKIGPLAVGVRSPVALALGVTTVASLTGSRVDIALGASSPAIVTGWHDRRWAHHVSYMRETIECLRSILTGARVEYVGKHVSSHGFRLRGARPDTRIAVGAFGPGMIRVAAQHADEVVLNLAPPARVAEVRAAIDAVAAAAGRNAPRLTVWVPVALDPGDAAHAPIGGSAGGVSRPARLRRNVQRAGFRRPRPDGPCRRDSPRTGGRRPGRAARRGVRVGHRRPSRGTAARLPRGRRRLRRGRALHRRRPGRPGDPPRAATTAVSTNREM